MTQPTNSIDSSKITCSKCDRENVINWKDGLCITCARDEVLGIDRELEETLIRLLHECDHEPDAFMKYVVIDQAEFVPKALQAIKALYRKEIEEAIGEDMTMKAAIKSHSDAGAGYTIGVNSFKAELRAKLLPPTKGGKE